MIIASFLSKSINTQQTQIHSVIYIYSTIIIQYNITSKLWFDNFNFSVEPNAISFGPHSRDSQSLLPDLVFVFCTPPLAHWCSLMLDWASVMRIADDRFHVLVEVWACRSRNAVASVTDIRRVPLSLCQSMLQRSVVVWHTSWQTLIRGFAQPENHVYTYQNRYYSFSLYNISYNAHSSNVNFYTGNITFIWLFISFWLYIAIFVLMCR